MLEIGSIDRNAKADLQMRLTVLIDWELSAHIVYIANAQ